jgi:hypothetical protein
MFQAFRLGQQLAKEGQMTVSEELLQRRKDAAERQRRSRANKKEREAEETERVAQRYFVTQQLVGRGQTRPGCLASGNNGKTPELCPSKTCQHFARNSDEWIFAARRWAVASNQPDIQYGESLNGFERRVYGHTTKKKNLFGVTVWELPYLSLKSGRFDDEFDAHFRFDPNDSANDIPALNSPMDADDIAELPTITATMRVETYLAALEENRKRIAFEQRIAKEEAEGVQRQLEETEARKLMSPMAVSLKMADEQ